MRNKNKLNNNINHIAFCLDKSGSIRNSGLESSIIRLFDKQIADLKKSAARKDQETRISVYLFNEDIECICFDTDISRVPSLKGIYRAEGDTAMIDATLKVIDDLGEINTSYGNSGFLVYVITDGQNRINNHLSNKLRNTINSLDENWTCAALVPDSDGKDEAYKFGFPYGNIKIWEVSQKGTDEISSYLSNTTQHYMTARSSGMTGTKSLFTLNAAILDDKKVKSKLEELPVMDYRILNVNKDMPIKEFVESWTKEAYRTGSAYYEINKPETVQPNKNICVQDVVSGRVYTGATQVRKMLGLPNFTVKVNPLTYNSKFLIFVQSSSTNRRLIAGTRLLLVD